MSTVQPMTGEAPRPTGLTDAEYRALAEFRRALRQFMAFSETAARDQGLAPAQHQLVLAVRGWEATGRAPGTGELADHLHLRAHSVSELVDRAVRNDLVARQADPTDGRRTVVVTTAHGRDVLERLSVRHREELRRFRMEMSTLLGQLEDDT